jgi:serine phosphatase RsbU (regulator of sigma subunit)
VQGQRAEQKRGGLQDLLETFRGPLIGGRWILVGVETLETVLLLRSEPPGEQGKLVLLLLFLYNAVSLVVLHRLPVRRVPLFGLLALDLLFVTAAAFCTGGPESPFLGQFYLIIFAASLIYGWRGALPVSCAAAAATVILACFDLEPDPAGPWRDLRDLIPYFLIAGAFSGFLVERVSRWFDSYHESQLHARQLEREAERALREQQVQAELATREMELARSMQMAALPASPPRVEGLDIAAQTEFARQVGGDFYLFLQDGGRVGLATGDVCGKGLPAALASTSICHLLPWLKPLRDARRALADLNADLIERLPDGSFATLALADVDLASRSLRLWNAGHPPALLYRAATGQVVETRVHNPLLGVLARWDAEPEECPFGPDDVLLLCTDGLVEARGPAGELFGMERAAAALAGSASRPASEIAAALVLAVREWAAPSDDLTVLICKRSA